MAYVKIAPTNPLFDVARTVFRCRNALPRQSCLSDTFMDAAPLQRLPASNARRVSPPAQVDKPSHVTSRCQRWGGSGVKPQPGFPWEFRGA